MMFDLAYHSFASLVVYTAMTVISYGGFWIAFSWLDKGDETPTTYAKCELVSALGSTVTGTILLSQKEGGITKIKYDIKDLKANSEHGFHIH